MRWSQKKWFIVIILKTDDELGRRWANVLFFYPFQSHLFPMIFIFKGFIVLIHSYNQQKFVTKLQKTMVILHRDIVKDMNRLNAKKYALFLIFDVALYVKIWHIS